jgi:chromosomal replication initiator protein
VKSPSIAEIQRAVAEDFGIGLHELLGKRRPAKFVRPRQVSMYLSRHLTRHSYVKLGIAFGRDHATIHHGVERTEAAMDREPRFSRQVARIWARLERPA